MPKSEDLIIVFSAATWCVAEGLRPESLDVDLELCGKH